jgi:hypothetical protein
LVRYRKIKEGLSVILGVNIIAAHNLLQGLSLQPAVSGGLGNIAAVFFQQPADEVMIELLEAHFLGGFVRQVTAGGSISGCFSG